MEGLAQGALPVAGVALAFVSAVARWLVVRVFVRGAPFPLLFARKWSWTTRAFGERATVIGAGLVASYLACVVPFVAGEIAGGRVVVDDTSMRVTVAANGPAAHAGVRDGDRVVGVGGEATPDWDTLKRAVAKHAGEPVAVEIERDGQPLVLTVTPNESGKMMVGPHFEKASPSIASAFTGPAKVLSAIARGFARVLFARPAYELAGPVGIVKGELPRPGLGDFFRLLGAVASYTLPLVALYTFFAASGGSPRRG